MFAEEAANAFPLFNVAAPAIEANRSSRRFIGMLFLSASVLAVTALHRSAFLGPDTGYADQSGSVMGAPPRLPAAIPRIREVLPDLRLADHPPIRVAGFPRFGLLQPCERIVIFGVVADDHIGAGAICDIH